MSKPSLFPFAGGESFLSTSWKISKEPILQNEKNPKFPLLESNKTLGSIVLQLIINQEKADYLKGSIIVCFHDAYI